MNARLLALGFIMWVSALGAGYYILLDYHHSPSLSGQVPSVWPAASQLTLHSNTPTLLVMLHPHCGCSKATLNELEKILARTRERLSVEMVFVGSTDLLNQIEESELWLTASRLPYTTITLDRDGVEAKHFGSFASGQVGLFTPEGTLLFQGGITSARGHEGDNLGATTIVTSVLSHATKDVSKTPVFGCDLFDTPSNATQQQIKSKNLLPVTRPS